MSKAAGHPGGVSLQALIERLGGHPARRLGIDLSQQGEAREGPGDGALGRWLVASCLLSGRAGEDRAEAAYRALDRFGASSPGELASRDPVAVARILGEVDYPGPEAAAVLLVRASRGLEERHAGSLTRLAGEAEGLEALGAALGALAPGLGRATLTRSLTPLREPWPAAADLPLDPAALAAAAHLGLLPEDRDPDGAHPALSRAAAARAAEDGEPAGDPIDLEAALVRLGRRACLRGRRDRCPLGEACPARSDECG